MKKRILFSFFLAAFVIVNGQDKPSAEYGYERGEVKNSHTNNVVIPFEVAVLVNNGPFVNAPGGGSGGADGSVLQNSTLQMNILGTSFASPTFRVADDFVVPVDEIWTIDSIKVFGYQTGGNSGSSSFTSANFRILVGPEPGGAVVAFGDETTNRMIATRWAGAYRYSETTPGTTRPIMEVVMSGGFQLQSGTYLLDYQAAGSIASGPWAPPITITGLRETGNAFQRIAAGYQPFNDSLAGGPPPARQGLPFIIYGTSLVVPVELTSFAANVVNNNVTLEWSTATETNNQGFELQRKIGEGDFQTFGFVNGFGTTTTPQSYTFVDKNLIAGTYSYRLKQIDFDGKFEYSNVIEVEIAQPATYSMEQNYPNPFNPSTSIKFSLAEQSMTVLKVFNILGQEVATLLNGELSAGNHEVNFDASKLTSGVYVYQLEAVGSNGEVFVSTKKMILNK